MHVSELQTQHISKLLEMAEQHGIENANRLRKQDLVFAIVRQMMKQGEAFTCSGTLEILPDGFGFLRSSDTSYLAGPDDIYVSPNQIRRFNLHTGDTIEGSVRVPKDNERYFALVRLDKINDDPPEVCKHKILFENLTPLFPTRQLKLERDIKAEENITSRALMEHCLDQQNALALAGWPAEDVLYHQRHQAPQPSHAVIFKLMKAIDAEQSLETFEEIMGEDPLLAYRFMVYTNSAALGLRTGIDSLRRGLVMMGYGSIKRWLSDQLPHASTDLNLRPVRESMLIRAQLMTHLLDAGVENDLRREIYLCGLLSQLDDVMGESLGTILRRIPLSERIYDANVLGTGPYVSGLQMARALESEDASTIRKLCETHEMDLEEVNRALLRVLADLEVERPAA